MYYQTQKRSRRLFIFFIALSAGLLFTSFIIHPDRNIVTKQAEPLNYSKRIPLYKMSAETVNDIISGLPLDRRMIFQFVIDGSTETDAEVIWYEASGMLSHGEGKPPNKLEKIAGTSGIEFTADQQYVLANNYLFVKDFKTYINTLPSDKYLYIEFKPIKETVYNHVYFKIKAVYTAQVLKDVGYKVEAGKENESVYADEGIDSNPSPPFKPGD